HKGLFMIDDFTFMYLSLSLSSYIFRTAMHIRVLCREDLSVLTLDGVKKLDTVLDLKTIIMTEYGIPIESQQLKMGRMAMLNDDLLSKYKVKQWSVLWL
ncbi:MAG: hypothetical protein ACKPKO_11660, partial [Candidatus Fonsibacter sp.]